MALHIVILAAGLGKRMYSSLPKVLHPVGGKPMLGHVIDTAKQLNPEGIHIIIGHGRDKIMARFVQENIDWCIQEQQLGTGHAVMQALPNLPEGADVLILSGDVPLIQLDTLQTIIQSYQTSGATQPSLGLLLAHLPDPSGLGRIIRNPQGQVIGIVEEKDANEQQRSIHEIYSGICMVAADHLRDWLPKLTPHNAQGEFYLTEILAYAVKDHVHIVTTHTARPIELQGVNNRLQLQLVERAWQHRCAEQLMLQGVTLADAHRIDIRGELHCGQDVTIDVNTVFIGHVTLGHHCVIGANCVLENVILGDHCHILPNSVLEGSQLAEHCTVGPFARLRPGTELASHCKIGNFVETKNAIFDTHSKANHLSYLGDAILGTHVNVGAGTITCNYDGANKHQTIIGNHVNIGSDTQLVAPIRIGENATIGAGSTIRKDAPPNELTLTESTQKTVYGWKRKIKDDHAKT